LKEFLQSLTLESSSTVPKQFTVSVKIKIKPNLINVIFKIYFAKNDDEKNKNIFEKNFKKIFSIAEKLISFDPSHTFPFLFKNLIIIDTFKPDREPPMLSKDTKNELKFNHETNQWNVLVNNHIALNYSSEDIRMR